jgi:hypothetical protein
VEATRNSFIGRSARLLIVASYLKEHLIISGNISSGNINHKATFSSSVCFARSKFKQTTIWGEFLEGFELQSIGSVLIEE